MPVTLCFFLSGAAALILQVLWTRMLGHVFGATTLAISTTLTAFMGGLALGSHLGGRMAPKLKRPILGFAVLESAVGLYGLLVPGLFSLMPYVQRAIGFETGVLGYGILRFLVVSVILILPTTAMGATLPLLAEGVVTEDHHMASRTGRLYAANTFGAVVGAFLAGFVLIPKLGISKTVYLAASIDLFVALLVSGLYRLGGGDALLLRTRSTESPDEALIRLEPVPVVGVTPTTERLSLLVFALSGAAAMALEVLGTRTVGVVIGASTYSFTLILTTFLIGLAGGAAIMSRKIDRIADPVRALAWVETAVGALALAGSVLVDKLPFWVHATARAHNVTTSSVYFTNFAIAAVVTFPSTLALGMVMPIVVRILAPSGKAHAGPIVGRAYAINTIGAIVGSFLAGFVVVPFIGVERGIALASGLSIALGLLLALARRQNIAAIGAIAVAGLAFVIFGPRWNVQAWTAGLFRMYVARHIYADGWAPSGKLVYHKDGIATTVTVERESDGVGVSLKVNGKVDASDIGDMPTQVLSGLLPIVLHDSPKKALVIGYGSGVTSGAVLQSKVESLTLAEIEHAVYEASNANFSHVNHKPWTDPRFRAVIDDGRNFLLTRDDTYDVIISEPSNPWMSGAASLFTQDFFRIAERRLAPGGIFLQWLQLYELAPENIHALIRTFHSVFPNVLVFTPDTNSNDTLLLGTKAPLSVDKARLDRAFADPRLADELKRANVTSPDDLFALFLLGTKEIPQFVGQGRLNTDDDALIEYEAPKDLIEYATKDARLPFVEGIRGKRLEVTPEYFTGYAFDGPMLADVAHRLVAQGELDDAEAFAKKAGELGADIKRTDRLIETLREKDSQPVVVINNDTKEDPRYARVIMEMTSTDRRDDADRDRAALRSFESEKNLDEVSTAHRFLYAYLCYRRDRDVDAEYLIDKVLKDEPFVKANAPVLYYAGRIYWYRGKTRQGVEFLERFVDLPSTETSSATAGR
jgi:spermidine synthase